MVSTESTCLLTYLLKQLKMCRPDGVHSNFHAPVSPEKKTKYASDNPAKIRQHIMQKVFLKRNIVKGF